MTAPFGKGMPSWMPTPRKPAKPKQEAVVSEHGEQARFVRWMRETYPEHRVFAIPNGGSRHMAEAANLKKEGVSPGVPDLQIVSLRLFIEMKRTKGGSVSKDQKDWIAYLRGCGCKAEVAYGFEEAKQIVLRTIGETK